MNEGILYKPVSETGSPIWLIEQLQGFSDAVFRNVKNALGQRFFFHFAFLTFPIINLLLIYFLKLYSQFSIEDTDPFVRFEMSCYLPFVWVCLVSSIWKLFGAKNSTFYFLLLSSIYLVAHQLFLKSEWSWHPIIFHVMSMLVAYAMIAGVAWIARTYVGSKYEGLSLAVGFAVFIVFYYLFLSRFYHWTEYSEGYDVTGVLILPISIFWAERTNVNKQIPYFSMRRIGQLLNIVNLSYPLPIEDHRFQRSDEKIFEIRLRGMFDLCVALIMLTLYYQLTRWMVSSLFIRSHLIGAGFLIVGFCYYLALYAKSYSALRFLAGMGRWIGIDLQDPFNYALLATSPMDHWRRWNTYYNGWARDFIFFPLLVRRYGPLLALVATFSFSFFCHTFHYFAQLGHDFLLPYSIFLIRSKLAYYVGQTLAIYIAIKIPWIWPSGLLRKGWMGVGLTTLMMILIHWATYIAI